MSLLALNHLQFGYSEPLLSPVTLAVNTGEIWAIVGANGAGKSTLIRTILGHVSPLGGSAEFSPGARPAYLPQGRPTLHSLPVTVSDYLILHSDRGRSWSNCSAAEQQHTKIRHLADEFELGALYEQPVLSLSGGEFQRVSLASVFASDPNLVFLDEPTSALDRNGEMELTNLLARYSQSHSVGVVMITHFLESARRFASHMLVLDRRGQTSESGSLKQIWPIARRQSDPAQDGWLTAILYAGLGGIAVLGLHWLPEEAHDLNTTLLGSSLLLLPEEGFVTLGAGAIVLVLFIWLQRALAQVYFFPESAAARGLPVRRLRVFTDLAGGSFIALAASTLGLLPVFAAAVLPAALASSLLRSLRWLPGVTALIGFLGSLAGFVLAYYLDTPVGPTQTSLWFLIWLPSVFLHRPAVR